MSIHYSIIIPTFNRPKRLEKCLECMTQLNFPKEQFEIIVVDDGSTDSLESIVNAFTDRVQVHFYRQTNAGPASARNTGAHYAKGQTLVFTDDDCEPPPEWLTTFSQHISKFPDAMLGGHVINRLDHNLYAEASQRLIDYLYNYFNADSEHAVLLTSNNLAAPRDSFLQLGGFDTSFPVAAAEDRELCDRWRATGNALIYVQDVIIFHAHDLNLRSFWKQHFNYGRGAWRFHHIRAEREREPIKIEPLRFYFDLLNSAASDKGWRRLKITALLLLSQISNACGFFYARVTGR